MSSNLSQPRRHLLAQYLPGNLAKDRRPWHVVVSSRLGRSLVAQRIKIAMTRRFVEQAFERGDGELIVSGSAAQPWAERACELLGIHAVKLAENSPKSNTHDATWQSLSFPPSYCRDQLSIELADRIDATHVRSGGTIMRLLRQRLEHDSAPSVQVLINRAEDKAAKELIGCGAIGYWMNFDACIEDDESKQEDNCDESHQSSNRLNEPAVIQSLRQQPERWLIHSTRQRTGPWPGQSVRQFEDWMLLSSPATETPSPLETLNRIIVERRLVGSYRTTSAGEPVVSFTALPISQWLTRRKFRPHLGRWDAEPYGVAIDRDAAARWGIEPVIYGDASCLAKLPEPQRWRYQSVGSTYDWTKEQEWRGRGVIDLSKFKRDEVIVFTRSASEIRNLSLPDWSSVTAEPFS